MAGERFCVRNSGVEAVVEGLGDHALEYMTGGMVINLGTTGRNLGAGMSGGVAYVFDESGDFVKNRLNPDMVNVYQLIECNDDEIAMVKARIEKHVALTGSARGQAILADWPAVAEKFLKIMPQDYERVLEAQTRAEERGLKGDDAILAAFEENVKAGH
jgi:glutamate synthase (ferredoxin)